MMKQKNSLGGIIICLGLIVILFLILLFTIDKNSEIAIGEEPLDNAIDISDVPNTFVPISDVTIESLNESLQLAGMYLVANQHKNGDIEYRYYPQHKNSSGDTNVLRQLLALHALDELYHYTQNQKYLDAYEKGLAYQVKEFYQENESYGYFYQDNLAKLGAAAVGFIALSDNSGYQNEKEQLLKFVDYMHNETSGHFYTIFTPNPNVFYFRNGVANQRFYSGEAMLALMEAYEQTNDLLILEHVETSFGFYKDYFVGDEKLPAFIPWHTMVDYKLHKATGNNKYVQHAFELNDWLVEDMLTTSCGSPEKLGRFYNSKKRDYGVPHVSSTGVYLEGLVYAYRLAKEFGDIDRMDSYREALLLGSRSLLQLQYGQVEIDEKGYEEKTLGGFRTTVTRPEIRVDNNQHAILALLGILAVLSEEEIDLFVESHQEYNCQAS